MSNKAESGGPAVAGTGIGEKLAGKYLTFRLAGEEYGLEILKVQEIIQMQTVTRVPRTPTSIRGVINLRGKVIPVIDLRQKFGFDPVADSERTCIIVVQIGGSATRLVMGVIIDAVREVLDIRAEDIEETPAFGSMIDTDFILGIGKIGPTVKILLDIDKIMSAREIDELRQTADR